jgi:exopolyphosphatase/guanosine-5'-triphosphate,3'-diphosphate pyrophosphatase
MTPAGATYEAPPKRRYGVLDIGSNSVRLVIYDVYGRAFSAIYSEKIHAGLGRDLARTQKLSPDGCTQTLEALRRFSLICRAQGTEDVLIAATAAMRDAKDAPEFAARVKAETGFDISPISGAEEARLSALGLIASMPRASGLAADLGGASLELISIDKGQPKAGSTFPLGPFSMDGALLSSGRYAPERLRERISSALRAGAAPRAIGTPLYLIGGAWRNLARISQQKTAYPLPIVQSYEMPPGAALDFANWAAGEGRETVVGWPDISLRRAETLPYGALLLSELISWLSPSRIIVSRTGLREGMIYNALPALQRQRDALLDGCRDLAAGNLHGGAGFAGPLYDFLAPASERFPSAFPAAAEGRLRRAACALAGIGRGLHPDHRADMIFETVLHAPLGGLDHAERVYLALILFRSFTGKRPVPNADAAALLLTPTQRRAALIYGLAIRLAIVASGRSEKLLGQLSLSLQGSQAVLTAASPAAALEGPRIKLRLKRLSDALEASQTSG